MHVSHGAYYYVDRGKWHHLCRVSEGEAKLYRELARVLQPTAGTLAELIRTYLDQGMGELKRATRDSYRKRAKPLVAVFGDMPPPEVTSAYVAQYLEVRKQAGKGVSGNREIALLSSVYNYGLRLGMVDRNPCHGVRRNKERPRSRYIRDDEFRQVFDAAPDHVQDLLALAYLTGLRQRDLRELRKSQVGPDGILLEESKTGKRRLIEWSDALRYFLVRAQTRAPESDYVLTNSLKQPWSEWAVQSVMRRLGVSWTFHDIRAKAESDHETGLGLLSLYKRASSHKPVR